MKLMTRNEPSTSTQEQKDLHTSISITSVDLLQDAEIYVGDEAVLARLGEIAQNIRENRYDENTKQSIYYYGETYIKDPNEEPSEYVKDANTAAKYYVTGWWLHQLIDANSNVEEKLTQTIAHQHQ